MAPTGCERISRLIYSKSLYDIEAKTVHFDAFRLPKNLTPPQLSVCCTETLADAGVWELALIVDSLRTDAKKCVARADCPAEIVEGTQLSIERDNHPFDRHANILGWPPEKQLERQKMTDLAQASIPFERPAQ